MFKPTIFNSSLRLKLILMTTIGALTLLYFSASGVFERLAFSKEMDKLGSLVEVSVKIGDLVHEMQIERGMSSSFISSNGANFPAELPVQREKTDKAVAALHTEHKRFDANNYSDELKTLLAMAMAKLEGRGAIRQSVNAKDIDSTQSNTYYTQTIHSLLDIPAQVAKLSQRSEISRLASSYSNLLKAKERAGMERALLVAVFALDRFRTDTQSLFWINFSAEDTYTELFFDYASASQKEFYNTKVSGPVVDEVTRMKKVAMDKSYGFGVDPLHWFQAATEKINLIKDVEDKLAADLLDAARQFKRDAERMAIFFVALTVLTVLTTIVGTFFIARGILSSIGTLQQMAGAIANGDLNQRVVLERQDELGQLAGAFNRMADQVQSGHDMLEQTVTIRTAELMIAKTEAEVGLKNLQQAQENLVQSEKMAALGGLVAGIAHEINTPVGVILMSATHLEAETDKISSRYNQGELSGDELESYFDTASQSARLMTINSQRAADLIYSFKQVAVDQTGGERREFELKGYIEEILLSLHPKLRRTAITVTLDCPENLLVDSYPGALSQILTNLIINSLRHAYQPDQAGRLSIRVTLLTDDTIRLIYSDDGQGIPPELQSKIFDPFFTTQRGNGGSGLGLHIVYNIVHQTLRGRLQMNSAHAQGTMFTLHFPRVCPRTTQ